MHIPLQEVGMNPASWFPLDAGRQFTQPRAYSPSLYSIGTQLKREDKVVWANPSGPRYTGRVSTQPNLHYLAENCTADLRLYVSASGDSSSSSSSFQNNSTRLLRSFVRHCGVSVAIWERGSDSTAQWVSAVPASPIEMKRRQNWKKWICTLATWVSAVIPLFQIHPL